MGNTYEEWFDAFFGRSLLVETICRGGWCHRKRDVEKFQISYKFGKIFKS